MNKIISSILKLLFKSIIILLLVICFFSSILYLNTTIYNFPESIPFKGNYIHNPYENLPLNTFKGNFHAHSIAWGNLTNGHNTEKEIYNEYNNREYDVIGISNYHKISKYAKGLTDLYVPMYEHGYNIFKSHYLAINSNDVSYFDYPLFQFISHKQKIIENLKNKNVIIAMAHPKFGGGRTFEDMKRLVNYDLTEVLNHYRISDKYWDEALSSGRLTYIIGNDDTHDIHNEATFKIWNNIFSNTRNIDSILNNLKNGKSYAINSKNGICDNRLISCEIDSNDSNIFKIKFENNVDKLEFIGQNGEIKKTIENIDSGTYKFTEEDTYIRVVSRNENSDLYLNPLVKFDGKNIPLNSNLKPKSIFTLTWLFRLSIVTLIILLIYLIRKTIKY